MHINTEQWPALHEALHSRLSCIPIPATSRAQLHPSPPSRSTMNPSAAVLLCLVLLSLSGTQGKGHQGHLIIRVRKRTELSSRHSTYLSFSVYSKEGSRKKSLQPAECIVCWLKSEKNRVRERGQRGKGEGGEERRELEERDRVRHRCLLT